MEVNKHINFLKRRGLLIEESSQIELGFDMEDSLDFKKLCLDGSDVFCKLLDLADREGIKNDPELSTKLVKSITKIYKHLKPPIKNNRSKFNRLVSVILDQKIENAVSTFDIIADVIDDVNLKELRKSISQLTNDEIDLGDEVLLKIINDIKHQSYTKYENSFIGDHFDPYRTRLELSYRGEDVLNAKVSELLLEVIEGTRTVGDLSDSLFIAIIDNFRQGIGKFIKADLKCKKPLVDENGNVIISEGDYVEVKKLDYKGDSYLSEFFAIYKNPDKLPEVLKTEEGLSVYNKVIDSLYIKLDKSGQDILNIIHESFAGIIYEQNRFIPKNFIKLYWSNKGQRIDDHRLSIRYRVNSDNFIGYIYEPNNDVLKTEKLKINMSPKFVLLPLTINEDTVTDRRGKDWDRYSPQGKMIRTKGGTVPLDNEFDWARKHIGEIPDDPHVEALINVLGSNNVIGHNFEQQRYSHYGLNTYTLQNGEEWAVGTEGQAKDALWEYHESWINDNHVTDLGVDLSNYLELPWNWITDYADDEAREILHDMDDEDLIEYWLENRNNDFYKYEVKEIKDLEKELENDITELDDSINSLNNRMEKMEVQNQDYLQYGYEEPQFTEEDFENIVNRIEELEKERESMEKHLEQKVEDAWYDVVESMRDDFVSEKRNEIADEVEPDPIQYFIDRGYGRDENQIISQLQWEDYIDKDGIIDYFVSDEDYGQMNHYDGGYDETTVDDRTYILFRIN